MVDTKTKKIDINDNKDLITNKSTGFVYFLQILGIFLSIPFIIAIILNYWIRNDLKGTLFESHCNWQIRTFWFNLAINLVLGSAFLATIITNKINKIDIESSVITGLAIIFVLKILWVAYRIVKGLVLFFQDKPIKISKSFV